jgi:hypothetical protein
MKRQGRDCRCSYLVLLTSSASEELRELGCYLSRVAVAGCDVVVLDPSPEPRFEENGRILRWVARHVALKPEHCTLGGWFDPIRAAVAAAISEKVIVAAENVRYTSEAIEQLCELLDSHEVVEPQDYLEPLPWWGKVEAGGILVHRGIEPQPDHGATFAFRRTAVRGLRSLGSDIEDDAVRRLAAAGAEVFFAGEVFVRREPGAFDTWIENRARIAGNDFALPMKSAFFFSLVPLLLLLTLLGEPRFAGIYAGLIAFSSVGLALRGRVGASAFFPLRACLFAPLWILERSISVYWALFRKLRGVESEPVMLPHGTITADSRKRSAS